MAAKTYSPKNVVVTYGGVPLTGFAEDTFIEVTFDEDAFTKKIGADGEGARAQSASNAGKVTLTLLQSSASNDVLSEMHRIDRLTGAGAKTLGVAEIISGRTVVSAPSSWIMKLADVTFAKEVGERQWVFDTDNMIVAVGGNN